MYAPEMMMAMLGMRMQALLPMTIWGREREGKVMKANKDTPATMLMVDCCENKQKSDWRINVDVIKYHSRGQI